MESNILVTLKIIFFIFIFFPCIANAKLNLFADKIFYKDNGQTLVATGNVQIVFGNYNLSTPKLTYNKDKDILRAEKPIRLKFGSDVRILANSAEITSDLSKVISEGAKALIDEQFQIASDRMIKSSDNETFFYKTVGSACTICPKSPIPIWQIRAEEIKHSKNQRTLTFRNAWMEVAGLPILFTPYLRTPEPGVKRATGLLTPKLLTSDLLGLGIKQPYYIKVNSSSDITLALLKASKTNLLLETEYRKLFSTGDLEMSGALVPKQNNSFDGYFSIQGNFGIFENYDMTFDITTVSNSGFLGRYDYSNTDRLKSYISLLSNHSKHYSEAQIIFFNSLRDNSRKEPIVLPSLYNRSFLRIPFLNTSIGREVSLVTLSNNNINDNIRISAAIDTQNIWTHKTGIKLTGVTKLATNLFFIDKPLKVSSQFRLDPITALKIEVPLLRANEEKIELIKPIVQIVYNPAQRNIMSIQEDSQQVQIDQTSLFSLNRFTGFDKQETGLRLNAGVEYLMESENDMSYSLAFGQIFRQIKSTQFSKASGLSGKKSDILLSGNIGLNNNISFTGHQLYDQQLNLKKSETSVNYKNKTSDLRAGLVNYIADPVEGRYQELTELTFEVENKINRYWSGTVDLRRNLIQNKNINALLGFTYENECIKIDLAFSKRFTVSDTLPEDTRVEINFDFNGFNRKNRSSVISSCMQPG